jgi:hypothetical protein
VTLSAALASPRAGELGVALPALSRAETLDAAFAAEARGSATLPGTATAPAAPAAPLAAATVAPSEAGTPRAPSAVLLHLTLPTLPTLSAAPAVPDQGPAAVPAPVLRTPAPRVESVGGDGALPGDEAQDAGPARRLGPAVIPAEPPFDLVPGAPADGWFPQGIRDACFADGSWVAPADLSGEVARATAEVCLPATNAAGAAGFALLLGGYLVAPRAEAEPRKRRPSLS